MKTIFRAWSLLFILCQIPLWSFSQAQTGLLIGDYNKVGDFISARPNKTLSLDPTKESNKFLKIKLGQKELVFSYKMTGDNKGAVRYFDPVKNEWVDVFTVDCCAHATSAKLMVFDGKIFKYSNDILFFYTEVYSDSSFTQPEKKQLQIAKFQAGSSFRKYNMTLNPKNKFPHKVIASRWQMREQFGDLEDKYKEFSLEDKVDSGL